MKNNSKNNFKPQRNNIWNNTDKRKNNSKTQRICAKNLYSIKTCFYVRKICHHKPERLIKEENKKKFSTVKI